MNRSLVVRVVIHAFDNVDFASCRPIRAVTPECGPRRTPGRHVYRVHYDESASVIVLRSNPDALTRVCHLRSGLHAHDSVARAVDRCQVCRLLWAERVRSWRDRTQGHDVGTHRSGLVNIYDRTVRWVATCEEVPAIEETAARLEERKVLDCRE